MKDVLYIIDVNEEPELLEKKRVPDYIIDDEFAGKKSVYELLEDGLHGLNLLAPLLNDHVYDPNVRDLHNAVSQGLSEKINDIIYNRKENEPLWKIIAAVTTIMDFIPFFGKFAYCCAVELHYKNLYELLEKKNENDVEALADMLATELHDNVVLKFFEPENA